MRISDWSADVCSSDLVMAWSTTEEAIALANDTSFGLSGSVIAGTEEEGLAIALRIHAGGISINDCGLTFMNYEPAKNSDGFSGMGGSRMGPASSHLFLRRKALVLKPNDPATTQARNILVVHKSVSVSGDPVGRH